jgi:hypothetical protein
VIRGDDLLNRLEEQPRLRREHVEVRRFAGVAILVLHTRAVRDGKALRHLRHFDTELLAARETVNANRGLDRRQLAALDLRRDLLAHALGDLGNV